VLSGLTGSAIVFDHAIDAWLNPRLFTPLAPGPSRPLDEILAAARAAVAGPVGGVSVTVPGVDYEVFVVHVSYPRGRDGDARPSARVGDRPRPVVAGGDRRLDLVAQAPHAPGRPALPGRTPDME
jgi:uncharacterized iron-regulated membrane protein